MLKIIDYIWYALYNILYYMYCYYIKKYEVNSNDTFLYILTF